MSTKLHRILRDVDAQIARSKAKHSIDDFKSMIKDGPSVRPFESSLRKGGFGVIAEIKEKSPSGSYMRKRNVEACLDAYEHSNLVKAISVLTEEKNFGMSIERLREARNKVSKPILRKDFIKDVHQVYEARAYGSDAILLMANVIPDMETMSILAEKALELGMGVLFESHSKEEFDKIPKQIASIYGINCRMMDGGTELKAHEGFLSRYLRARIHTQLQKVLGKKEVIDKVSTDFSRFKNLIGSLPSDAVKVAESGICASRIREIYDLGFNAALIGTSLLLTSNSIYDELNKFEKNLNISNSESGDSTVSTQVPVFTH